MNRDVCPKCGNRALPTISANSRATAVACQSCKAVIDRETARIFNAIGRGNFLPISRDGAQAKLFRDPRHPDPEPEQPIDCLKAIELSTSRYLHELTEAGEPPADQRKPYTGCRIGWREAKLPGEQYRCFVLTQ